MMLLPCALRAPLLGLLPMDRARQHVQTQWRQANQEAPPTGAVRRLFVDVSVISCSDARTGIQRVVRAVLRHLLDHPPQGHEVVPVAGTRKRAYQRADVSALFPEHACALGGGQPIAPAAGDTFLALDLTANVLPFHWDQLRHWRRSGVSIQAVVYDLLPVLHPEWFSAGGVRHFRRWIKTLAIFADRLHCISRVVAEDVRRCFESRYGISLAPCAVRTFSLGSDIPLTNWAAGLSGQETRALEFASGGATALVVGTIEPRKAHAEVLDAFEALWHDGGMERLLIVGAPGWKTDKLQRRLRSHAMCGDRLLWLDDVNDTALTRLYQTVAGVIVASKGEGMGLPVVEAHRFGRPLLVRDIPVFHELVFDAADYFPDVEGGLSSDVLRDWIDGAWSSPAKGGERAPVSWSESVRQLCENMGFSMISGGSIMLVEGE